MFKKDGDSETLVKKLHEAGYESFYEQFQSRRGSTFYRVNLGRFKTFKQAQNYLAKHKNSALLQEFSDSFVRVSNFKK